MASQDISRFLLQPNKHYSSLHLQQGRVIVDSDWNERANIEAEERRATLLDIVCARGTPNDGFELTVSEVTAERDVDVTVPGEPSNHKTYTFDIGGGSYFLGGMRLAIEGEEDFLTQSDWLQVTSSTAYMPARPDAVAGGTTTRVDLVYVYAWEQPVTAVEDSELAEVALGGRDTSTRVKRMRRFVVKTDVTGNCADAFDEAIDELEETIVVEMEAKQKAQYNAATGELVSNGRLRVVAASVDNLADPCADPTASGYVGADNQTIRVELRPPANPANAGGLIWGFDNASKLYRVQVEGTTVTFLTTPQDLPSMPRKGQVVEFLQWGAKLPNGEKVAETQGLLTKVASNYDPRTKELEIDPVADLVHWNTWLTANAAYHNLNDPEGARKYLYMRVWDRGSDVASLPVLDFASFGATVDIGTTGLQVVVDEPGKDGDYWIIAARPSTPDVVTPWDLNGEDGVAPHGPRRFYTPLGLISVTNSDPLDYAVEDCRVRLRKLCEGGACTVTVGDGKKSFGDFNSLQAAVESVGDGSKICVLPGEHLGQTEISGFDGLTIEGYGFRSLLKNPQPTETNPDFTAFEEPVIKVVNSSHVFIRDLGILGFSAVGVSIGVEEEGVCSGIRLENLGVGSTGGYTIDTTAGAAGNWRLPAPCITVAGASKVDIINCQIYMADIFSYSFAVVLGGNALSMRGCKVDAPTMNRVSQALSGINVRSGSRDVEIIGCDIRGGRGHGIALGHGRMFEVDQRPTGDDVTTDKPGEGTSVSSVQPGQDPNDCECEDSGGVYTDDTYTANPLFLPAGAVEDVRIYDNRIREMGLSGISTTLFWPRLPAGYPLFIVVTDIDIARKVIEDNVRRELASALFLNGEVAVGGVCLAASANAWIHENTIRNNGTDFLSMPICGVGMIAAMNAVIEDNQIVDNGVVRPANLDGAEPRGLRGGIVVFEATAIRTTAKLVLTSEQKPTFPTTITGEVPYEGKKNWTGVSSQSAVTVRGNEVSHLLGRALWIVRGFGPIVVTGNSLQSYGSPVTDDGVAGAELTWVVNDMEFAGFMGEMQLPARGACVQISNYGLPEDKWVGAEPDSYPRLYVVDPGQEDIDGGSVLVSGNRMRLEWEWYGGWAASVLVQSLGSVVFNDNVSEVVMENGFPNLQGWGDPEKNWGFSVAVFPDHHEYSFVLTNVFVGGSSSVSLTGNRMTEGRWDAVFSALVANPALAVDAELVQSTSASVAVANIGSHCIVARTGDTAFRTDNLEIYPLKRVAGPSLTFTCADADITTAGVSGSTRLVGASITIKTPS